MREIIKRDILEEMKSLNIKTDIQIQKYFSFLENEFQNDKDYLEIIREVKNNIKKSGE